MNTGIILLLRWVGVKVLKFSIGFGPRVVGRQVGDTEYVVSAIPLGGYVKMFGEEGGETISDEEAKGLLHAPIATSQNAHCRRRSGIQLHSQLFNFYRHVSGGVTSLCTKSRQRCCPIVEVITPDSPAALSGLEIGDHITQSQ